MRQTAKVCSTSNLEYDEIKLWYHSLVLVCDLISIQLSKILHPGNNKQYNNTSQEAENKLYIILCANRA